MTTDAEPGQDPVQTLRRFPEDLAVVRLGPGADVPDWAESSSIFSVTATATETSVVCAARQVPKKSRHAAPPSRRSRCRARWTSA